MNHTKLMVPLSVGAALLGVKPQTVHGWRVRENSPLPIYKVGGRLYFKAFELEAYQERQRDAESLSQDSANAARLCNELDAISARLEGMLNDIQRTKTSPHIVLSLFRLAQAMAGLLWAAGLLKGNNFFSAAKALYSRQGWNRYHAAQLEVAEKMGANHAE